MSLTAIFLMLFAYLIGSISPAIIVSRMMGKEDPREAGSKNPGATNVYRTAGTKAAILTLVGDISKGLIPVWFAQLAGLGILEQTYVAIAALVGHCYPLFFKFRGGKGVATAFGALVMVNVSIGLSLLGVWLATMIISRTSSIAAMMAALTVPLSTFYVLPEILLPLCGMALLVVWRHHENIMKIIEGREDNFKR